MPYYLTQHTSNMANTVSKGYVASTIHHGVVHHHRVVHQLVYFEFLDEFESNHHSSGLKADVGLIKWCGEVGTTPGAEVSTWSMKS